jgi:hypothetical protein
LIESAQHVITNSTNDMVMEVDRVISTKLIIDHRSLWNIR